MGSILISTSNFGLLGHYIMVALLLLACLIGFSGALNLLRSSPIGGRQTRLLLWAVSLVFIVGFLWICWFHYQIHCHLPLELPDNLAGWLNKRLRVMNTRAAYVLPLYDPANPPRYTIPVWIENEKYYFWFMCYCIMALIADRRIKKHRMRAVLHLLLAGQVAMLFFAADPFNQPLPKFFAEVSPWFEAGQSSMSRIGRFMRLYPKMTFYYNAHYMWLHPPLLFLAYACITFTFVASVFMLIRREPAVEILGYDFAKLGYFLLTLGMLLGYPWALEAWGPNWWWDPKICSSIMMWAVFTTYLHTRIYIKKPSMWYFSSALGILCYLSMIFTFLTSFYFPGEHTLH
jgi:ABC-type transport system involved in cytochrome c biogenesis permease subunit